MLIIVQVFAFFWFIRTVKTVLFWIYLWQLKEYHIGRFLDHFRTEKGKKIFFNFLFLIKLFILPLIFINFFIAFYVLLLIYILEFLSLIKKNFKYPVWTKKTIFLTLFSLIFLIIYSQILKNLRIDYFIFELLIFDILSPIIVSIVVLLFQPLFVLARNIILKKAKEKISKHKNLIVIGITGSYGKTSTKEFLTTILSLKFNALRSPSATGVAAKSLSILSTKNHQNSEIGIAECILNDLNNNHRVFVVEMGSYKKGGIKLLCDIVKPKIGIVTGVNEQHLSLFGSMENLLSAEGGRELLVSLPVNGVIVINGDNKYCLDLYKSAEIKKRIYSLRNDKIDPDIWTEDITVEKEFLSFIAMNRQKEMVHFSVNVLGAQNAQNLLGAVVVAQELGMSLEEISLACKNIKPEQAGIALKDGVHGINIIDSSYSSNPDGVMADLDYLNIFSARKIVIMPCLIELGNKSAEIHGEIGKKIAEVCDMAIITTKDRFEEIKEGAGLAEPAKTNSGILQNTRISFSDNPKEIFHTVTTFCKSSDAILLEGRVPSELIKLLVGK